MKKYRVGILGATGIVGQRYLLLLKNHPWFEVKFLAASSRSAGMTYADCMKDQNKWKMSDPIPAAVASMQLFSVEDIARARTECDFVFSALESDAARLYEPQYAAADLPVFSNAGSFRSETDIPVIIPEINSAHAAVIDAQRRNRGFKKGFIVAKPNCSIQSFLIPLHSLQARFGLQTVQVTTMQAVSGAGYPGVASFDIIDNVVPYISGEEDKTETEPLKILGNVLDGKIVPFTGLKISAQCNRVPVMDGHMACVSVKFKQKPTAEEIRSLWSEFRGLPQERQLPSAPQKPIHYFEEFNRPQSRLDRDLENGMAISVGRLRPCPILDFKFVGLSHNTIRGAAGGGVLCAETLCDQGLIG